MKTDLMNIIFGMKVRKARQEMGLSLSAFAKECRISPSYLTEIEKGRKYPKRDKIMAISNVTGIDYDELVSIRLAPSLTYLESALSSSLISEFPFEEFGVELGNLVDVLTQAPLKASALIHAVLQIGRRYDMKEEHFLRAVLRSFQEMNDNHFPEIEQAAEEVVAKYNVTVPLKLADVSRILEDEFGIEPDTELLAQKPALSSYRSVLVKTRKPRLLVNPKLHSGQQAFLVAREIGHRVLGHQNRSLMSPPDQIESFDQVLNDFKASYFAGALMMPQEALIADIEELFGQEKWRPELLVAMMNRYAASPEILFYRMTELVPQHFGVDLHFLRFFDNNGRYLLSRQLNMNQLPLPSGFGLHEHYCRRWLTVRLLQDLKEHGNELTTGVQLSEFLHKPDRFLCFGLSRPLALQAGISSSVILGFRVTPELRSTIRFVDDADIPTRVINDTCERCPLLPEECSLRAIEPREYQKSQAQQGRKQALNKLMAELRS